MQMAELEQSMNTNKKLNKEIEDSIKKLTKIMEHAMWYGYPAHEVGLRSMLNKFGVKSSYSILNLDGFRR